MKNLIETITELATDVHVTDYLQSRKTPVHTREWWANRANEINELMLKLTLPIPSPPCKSCFVASWCVCETADQKLAKVVKRFFDAKEWRETKLSNKKFSHLSASMSLVWFMRGDMNRAWSEASMPDV